MKEKELSIEEKAKRYDEIIRESSKIIDYCAGGINIPECVSVKATIEQILPELKESEEERTRKGIIKSIMDLNTDWLELHGITKKNAIAWLEKQGEQNNNEDADILQRFSFYSYKDEPSALYLSSVFVNEEYRNRGIGTKILEVTDEVAKSLNCHTIRLKTKKDSNAERLYRTHGYNSLTTEDNDEIWLEKQSNKNEIDYDEELKKCKANPLYFFDKYVKVKLKEQKPADEEMIETLRAEYEKGRADVIAEMQKPAWSKEDETKLTIAQLFIRNTSLIGNDEIKKATIYWLNDLKNRVRPQSKQEWKQENTGDLNDFENAMMHIGVSFFGNNAGLDPNDTNAIKEQANLLLELVPNKEWSEEDERWLDNAIVSCEQCGNTDTADWLKSLRPQNTWKPSDEQINALEYYIYSTSPTATITKGTIYGNLMVELLEQLKKLREE